MSGRVTNPRIKALRRFGLSISVFTVAGALVLGFESSWAQPLVALATAYSMEVALEAIDAWAARRPVRFGGGIVAFVDFILPAHISALSISLLLYPNQRLMPIVFATTVAVASKFLLQAPVRGGRRHFLNPSNLGICATLLLFPWVGISPPYHFTENVAGLWDWVIPLAVLAAGTMLNATLTGKWPIVLGWVGGFAAQAVVRHLVLGVSLVGALLPMTGLAFFLYTNYMITDPGTTPIGRWPQVVFGVLTAAVYGFLVTAHVVFGLFFALVIVCGLRGAGLYVLAFVGRRRLVPAPASVAGVRAP
jgi:hypothetical protein